MVDSPSFWKLEHILFVGVHPPTQEATALAVEECVTSDGNALSEGSTMLRRISHIGG